MAKIGIDFGTTNSLLVAFDKDKKEFTYFNYIDNTPVPTSSTVWYHDNDVVVGDMAREKMYQLSGVDGHHFERSVKLKLANAESINIFGERVQPHKVAGQIINKLKEDSIQKYKANILDIDLNRAVFTIPVNFSGKSREELRRSAHEAGIEITTFIHEPFAAIVAYYFNKCHKNHTNVVQELDHLNSQYLLTFDWGGGTLDITVVQIENGKISEKGTSELTNRAGDKFDEDLARYVWSKFIDQKGKKYNPEYLEKIRIQRWGRLLSIAEKCKIQLSTDMQSEFILERVMENENIDIIIHRDDFTKIIESTVTDALNKIDEALKQAGIKDIDISSVLLIGGTCNIPAIQKAVTNKFGHRVVTVENPELLIAQGAAIISEMAWLPVLTKDILVQLSDDSYYPLFERNLPIASNMNAVKSETFTCVDHRGKNAKVIICEGLDQDAHKTLGIINVPLLGHDLFGDDIFVEAKINRDIVLHVSGYSKMSQGHKTPEQQYSVRKSCEINQLCFGLDIKR